MAAETQARRRGRPPGKSLGLRVTFKLPQHHFEYLKFLALEKKRFGDTPNDAAKYLLIRELEALFTADYHNREIK